MKNYVEGKKVLVYDMIHYFQSQLIKNFNLAFVNKIKHVFILNFASFCQNGIHLGIV